MAFQRSVSNRLPAAVRSIQSTAARRPLAGPTRPLNRTTQRSARRSYSSESPKGEAPKAEAKSEAKGGSKTGGNGEKTFWQSDWPWAIPSIGITVPGTYYLLPPMFPKKDEDKDKDGDDKEEKEGDDKEDDDSSDKSGDDGDSKDDDKDSEESSSSDDSSDKGKQVQGGDKRELMPDTHGEGDRKKETEDEMDSSHHSTRSITDGKPITKKIKTEQRN